MVGSLEPLLPVSTLTVVVLVLVGFAVCDVLELVDIVFLEDIEFDIVLREFSVGLAVAEEDERVLAVDVAPDRLDEAPLPTGLPSTFTCGLDTAFDCEPEELMAVESDPDVEV